MRIFMIHGGIWEPMTARRFWYDTGIAADLTDRGLDVIAPQRLDRPPGWDADTAHLETLLPDEPVPVLAASNGGTPGVRLALRHPGRVSRLLLAWPATCGDTARDPGFTRYLAGQGATAATITDIVSGQTLRGVTDTELAGLEVPVALLRAPDDSPAHRPHTADGVRRLTGAADLGVYDEPPRPGFAAQRAAFADVVAAWATT